MKLLLPLLAALALPALTGCARELSRKQAEAIVSATDSPLRAAERDVFRQPSYAP